MFGRRMAQQEQAQQMQQAQKQAQTIMQENKTELEMKLESYQMSIYAFGAITLLGIIIQIVLQSKTLRELRRGRR